MKTVADTMGVSRSRQYEKQRTPLQKEKRFYCRKDRKLPCQGDSFKIEFLL